MQRRRAIAAIVAVVPLAVTAMVVRQRRETLPVPGPVSAVTAPPRPAPPSAGEAGSDTPVTPGATEDGPGEAPEVATSTVTMICRDALGLLPAIAGGVVHEPLRVTVHHSAFLIEDAADAPGQLRAFQRDHQRRGWVDVAYHRAVDPAGNVYELRDPGVEGDSGTEYDTTGHLQLLCLGDYDQQEPTPALLETLARLIAAECAARDLPLATLSAHRDHVLTWCPGGALYARLEEVRARAEELLAAGAPALQPLCGEEGAARVAAIEAGA